MNRNMEAITWALHARGISPTAFRLLIQLCSYVNSGRNDFAVWPSHKTVAEAVEISVSGVKRHLAELVDRGFISIEPKMRGDGGRSSNVYLINVDTEHKMPKGVRVSVNSAPIGQIDLAPQVKSEPAAQATADLCSEPLKDVTSEILKEPSPPTEDVPSEIDRDFFGEHSQALATVPQSPSVDEFVGGWNLLATECGLSTVAKLTNARRRAAAAQLRRFPQADWQAVWASIRSSEFLKGDNDRGWRVDFDWILSEKNFVKVLEGKYAGGRRERKSVREIGMMLAAEETQDHRGEGRLARAADTATPFFLAGAGALFGSGER